MNCVMPESVNGGGVFMRGKPMKTLHNFVFCYGEAETREVHVRCICSTL